MKKENTGKKLRILTLIATVFLWAAVPGISYLAPEAPTSAQCPDGPFTAELTGTATGGKTPSGTAKYNEKSKNKLQVKVKGLSAGAVSVFIGETNVGNITVPAAGNGDLNLETMTAAVTEGATISVRTDTATVLSGTFACASGAKKSPSPSGAVASAPTPTPTPTPTVSPTVMPTITPMPSPSPSPTLSE